MSMEEFGDLFFVARDVRQKAFELLRHRAKHIRSTDIWWICCWLITDGHRFLALTTLKSNLRSIKSEAQRAAVNVRSHCTFPQDQTFLSRMSRRYSYRKGATIACRRNILAA